MKTFLLATHNENKAREFRTLLEKANVELGEFRLLTFSDIGYREEIEESGTTFEENAVIKASVGAALGYITFADDSGLTVDALGGAPGIYSARYSGEHGDDEENNRLLLKNLSGVTDRRAHYVCAIACVFPDKRMFTVRGTCDGEIGLEYHGDGGFGYDPLFYVPELNKTFAEVTLAEKNKISHRGRATEKFAAELCRRLKEEKDNTDADK